MTDPVTEIEAAGEMLARVQAEIAKRIIGQEDVVALSLTAILSGGHALLVRCAGAREDPLGRDAWHCLGLPENRIQFTPDLMPADILGSEFSRKALTVRASSSSSKARCSRSFCWRTRSTARARGRSRHFCKRCRRVR